MCFGWARDGLCARLEEHMRAECAAACGLCGAAARPADPCAPARDNVAKGDIGRIFRAAVKDLGGRLAHADPPVAVFDAFAGAEEVEEVVRLAEGFGFHPPGSGCGTRRPHALPGSPLLHPPYA